MKKWFLPLVLMLSFTGLAWAEDEAAVEEDEVRYVDLSPAFVANYGGPGKLKYIKAEVSLRVNSQDAFRAVMHHIPSIRHAVVMLLSRQSDESVTTLEGKEQMRLDALAEVQSVMESEEGEKMIDELLFSSFFVQK